MKNLLKISALALLAVMMLSACGKKNQRSSTTGWKYNDTDWGGFEKLDYQGQATGPNLVLVEGGTFSMGITEQDVMFEHNNVPRRVTVSSFYIDETEVSNIGYREYLFWIHRVFNESYPEVHLNALPDTLVWREELSFNEPFVETYLRHPSYDDYPVVGISWIQANEYCKWRTDRVNEFILIEKGILNPNDQQRDEDNFVTESYLVGQYEGSINKQYKDQTGTERNVRFEDGILLPAYRLPTEAEWEYAALGLLGNQAYAKDERITDRRLYPWNGNTTRYTVRGKYQGQMMANFKRGRGDFMGMAGKLNDNAHITAPVRSFMPNDYGIYHMAGNVSEWVMDVYRPMTSSTLRDTEDQDLNPFRGNVFQQKKLDEEGRPVEKDSIGRLRYEVVKDEDVAERLNYQRGDVISYLDGDKESEVFYNYGISTLISDKARVIKGGSWNDRAYWMTPGSRRHLDEDRSSRSVGFRCAMTRVGGPQGNTEAGGNQFPTRYKKKVKRKFK
ncbi:MAG: SUMF1/EgtB/PvdO family nonheme iron enzyme [Bacteroidota bacterium]